MRIAALAGLLLATAAFGQAPWLPKAEQARILGMMPEGVPADGVKFYRLRQVVQSLTVTNGAPLNQILPVRDPKHPWAVSGGMHFSPADQWKNYTGLVIPEGKKIAVWTEQVDAGAPLLVPRVRWRFPEGTVAYDVLVRRKGAAEHVFEVRTHERTRNGWAAGTTYRPEVEAGERQRKHTWTFSNPVFFGGQQVTHTVNATSIWRVVPEIAADVPFAATRSLVTDQGGFTPRFYQGTGVSCMTCHALTGRRTGYGEAIRGDDNRFSWHPFGPQGNIDGRWPVSVKK